MTAGRTNHTRFASGTGSTQGVPLTKEAIEAIVHYNVRSAAYAFVSSLIPRADKMDHSSPLWYGWALREAFIAGHHHALNNPIYHPTLDDLREWRKVIDDMITEASPPNPFRELITREFETTVNEDLAKDLDANSGFDNWVPDQSPSNIESGDTFGALAAYDAYKLRKCVSLKDRQLEARLFNRIDRFEAQCNSIGPTPLRHRLSELIVQMRGAIWAFDQAAYESGNEPDPSPTMHPHSRT